MDPEGPGSLASLASPGEGLSNLGGGKVNLMGLRSFSSP